MVLDYIKVSLGQYKLWNLSNFWPDFVLIHMNCTSWEGSILGMCYESDCQSTGEYRHANILNSTCYTYSYRWQNSEEWHKAASGKVQIRH